MIELIDSIEIAAVPERIFTFAAPVERWPEYLPHYRRVDLLSGDERDRVVRMCASRSGIPVRWIAREQINPERLTMRFTHIAGWTRGMEVVWRFDSVPGGTRVAIVHHLQSRFPFAAEFLGRHLVGEFFIAHIAGKTLACMKHLAEGAP